MEKNRVKIWLKAFRLRTLSLSLSCIFMGSFLAIYENYFQIDIFLLSISTTVFLQILSNLANDYGDTIHGADSKDRKGPSRVVQSGAITRISMKRSIIFFTILSFFNGFLLLFVALRQNITLLLIFLGIGLLSIFAAINYTLGKRPYGYAGLGDISVLIFFGIIGVGGTYFLQLKTLDWQILLPALSCGFLATGVLNINNIRDMESDEKAGKKSIPVRIGRKNAVIYHWFLLLGSMVSAFTFTWINYQNHSQLLFLIVTPLLLINAKAVLTKTEVIAIDPFLKQLALSTLVFVISFGTGLLLSLYLN